MNSSEVVVCPKLEELVLVSHAYGGISDMTSVIEMAASRASRGRKLGTAKIADHPNGAGMDIPELRKHVWNVEYYPRVCF